MKSKNRQRHMQPRSSPQRVNTSLIEAYDTSDNRQILMWLAIHARKHACMPEYIRKMRRGDVEGDRGYEEMLERRTHRLIVCAIFILLHGKAIALGHVGLMLGFEPQLLRQEIHLEQHHRRHHTLLTFVWRQQGARSNVGMPATCACSSLLRIRSFCSSLEVSKLVFCSSAFFDSRSLIVPMS